MVCGLKPYNLSMDYYYFYFKYKFYAWIILYLPFGSFTLHTPLIPVADWLNKILGPLGIYFLLGGRADCGGGILW